MQHGLSLSFVSVFIERYFDILAVTCMFLLIEALNLISFSLHISVMIYLSLGISLFVLSVVALYYTRPVKIIIKKFSGIFNYNIELKLMNFFWTLITAFKDVYSHKKKWRLGILSLLMWAVYILSYGFFAEFVSQHFLEMSSLDMIIRLFSQSSREVSMLESQMIESFRDQWLLYFYMYLALPIGALAILSQLKFLWPKKEKKSDEADFLHLLPHVNIKERQAFLAAYFEGHNRGYFHDYLKINREISILRDCSAGSNATTLLCQKDSKTFFRKYVIGEGQTNLVHQINWLESHQSFLPVAKILNKDITPGYAYYDMDYINGSLSFFEYIHTSPILKSKEILKRLLGQLHERLHSKHTRSLDLDTYIHEKVTKNLDKMAHAKSLKHLIQYDHLIINGDHYKNLSHFMPLLSVDYLKNIFSEDLLGPIHGDLTVENIVVIKGHVDQYYLIDPNSVTAYESPYLDYGKLLQSLHGSYEFLVSATSYEVTHNQINFVFTRSKAYEDLLESLIENIEGRFSKQGLVSIFFHEVIHWLRLMPYKLSKDPEGAVVFYAGLVLVLNDLDQRFKLLDKEEK